MNTRASKYVLSSIARHATELLSRCLLTNTYCNQSLFAGEPAVPARVLVLLDPDLHSLHHARHRILGLLLA